LRQTYLTSSPKLFAKRAIGCRSIWKPVATSVGYFSWPIPSEPLGIWRLPKLGKSPRTHLHLPEPTF
jgi:hypothetical protein